MEALNVRHNPVQATVKTGKLDQACQRYALGRNSMRQVAREAGAEIHIGRSYLINYSKVDAYMDAMSE